MNRRGFLLSAVLAMAVSGCYDTNKYLPASPDNPDGELSSPIGELTTDQPTIRATGGAHATITARIDPRSSVKMMKFTTTRGVLSGHGLSTSPEKPAIDVPVSDSGVVTVDLQSSTQPGLATVTASITLPDPTAPQTFTRTVDVTFSAVAPTDVITLVAAPATADADGATRISLTATMLPEVATANTTVVFTASAGDFASNKDATTTPQATVPISGGVATVQLISPGQPGTVIVTAQVATFRSTAQVSFNRAAPDTIFVQPAKSTVALMNDTVEITVLLVRDVGQTANNTVVTYEVTDSTGATKGTFLAPSLAIEDPSDGGQFKRLKSTATFDPDSTMATGPATITVRAAGKSASTVIQVN